MGVRMTMAVEGEVACGGGVGQPRGRDGNGGEDDDGSRGINFTRPDTEASPFNRLFF